jgi:GTP-binding protein LepA
MKNVRNFCIIAHIDHGKSTLADRFLEVTGVVDKSKMHEQMLDSMDLERERGITIKLQPVHMTYTVESEGKEMHYDLNLIDTPGHVDFAYEVSRSLAAVEGAVLLVDATQGVQAQTLANLTIARKHNLAIVPVVNKIDLPNAEPERVAFELSHILNCDPDKIIFASGKTGEGVETIIERIISDIPAPPVSQSPELRALVFDSQFNSYRGVIAQVRVVEGSIKAGDTVIMMANKQSYTVEEVGSMELMFRSSQELVAGDIGYVVTGLKRVADCRVGDTITHIKNSAQAPLAGYQQPQPMVFASLFSADGNASDLRTALEKLSANDASLTFEPQHSDAFGAGFRVGFLGLLHLEITKERLEREFGAELIITTPVVAFRGDATEGYLEPWVKAEIVTPPRYIGAIMEIAEAHRGVYTSLTYFGLEANDTTNQTSAILMYDLPLAEIIIDFNDQLKSLSAGYASLSYELVEYRPGDLVELSVFISGEKVTPFNQLVPANQADARGRQLTKRLKELIPKQMFEVSIQAAVGARIVARENVPALRKDVTAKLYGGDITRKRKLLEKQKEGKRKMRQIGRVALPTNVFLEALKPARD